jgi:hypothetical protein
MEFYIVGSGQVLTANELQINTGFPPTTDPGVLAANGIYTVTPSPDPYNPGLYTTEPSFVIAGNYALESWVATPRSLPTAKENASEEVKTSSNTQADALVTSSGVNLDIWTGAASQLAVDRPPFYNTLLGEMAAIGDNLAAQLTAIDAATTVDEINSIVNNVTGTISTGRGGSGGDPLDMNPSTMTVWNSTTIDVTDTELYIPASSSVVPYDAGLAPYTYAQTFGAFNEGGDYTVQLRQISTGITLAEWVCPLNAVNVPINF